MAYTGEVINAAVTMARGRRKQQHQIEVIRQAHTAQHIAHILDRLYWRDLFKAHVRSDDYYEENFHEVKASLAILSTWISN